MKFLQVALLAIIGCALFSIINSSCRGLSGADYWSAQAQTYLEEGLPECAFQSYENCIAEGSANAVIYHDFGDLLLLSREEAAAHYDIDTQQVFDRACLLFKKALSADPRNCEMAAEIARSHYLVQPWRQEEALKAWEQALSLATTDDQRDEISVQFARAQLKAGLQVQALNSLSQVRSPEYATLKRVLLSRMSPPNQ
jgi:tetratricopeptide (TPR) repeat protein